MLNLLLLLLEILEKMIHDGTAYVDDTPAEVMKQEREKRLPSKCRNQCTCKFSTCISI